MNLGPKGPMGLNALSAADAARKLASGEITSEALVRDCLARIEARPSFKAAVTDYFTPEDSGHFANIDEGAPALSRKILAA